MIEYFTSRRENNYVKVSRRFAKTNKSFIKTFSIFLIVVQANFREKIYIIVEIKKKEKFDDILY